MNNMPRIRTRSAEIESPPEHAGKWTFFVEMWTMDGETRIGEPLGPYGVWPTQAAAIAESKKAAQLAAESVEMKMTGKISGKYFDLKNGGVMRSWIEN